MTGTIFKKIRTTRGPNRRENPHRHSEWKDESGICRRIDSTGCLLAVDFYMRVRLKSAGYKWAFLRGETLDYSEYTKLGKKQGWPTWPPYVFWTSTVVGLVLFIFGLVSQK